MRRPTQADLRKIHELLAVAGGAPELVRWIKVAAKKPRKRGRPPGDKWENVDFTLLQEIEQRFGKRPRGTSVSQVIAEVVSEQWPAGKRLGASQKAVERRLFSRIRPTVLRAKGIKITLSKPQFEGLLAQSVRPRGRGRVTPLISAGFGPSGFRPPFIDPPGRIERPPPVYQPGSLEWREQQDRARTEKK